MKFWIWGPTTILHYCMSLILKVKKSLHPIIQWTCANHNKKLLHFMFKKNTVADVIKLNEEILECLALVLSWLVPIMSKV